MRLQVSEEQGFYPVFSAINWAGCRPKAQLSLAGKIAQFPTIFVYFFKYTVGFTYILCTFWRAKRT